MNTFGMGVNSMAVDEQIKWHEAEALRLKQVKKRNYMQIYEELNKSKEHQDAIKAYFKAKAEFDKETAMKLEPFQDAMNKAMLDSARQLSKEDQEIVLEHQNKERGPGYGVPKFTEIQPLRTLYRM